MVRAVREPQVPDVVVRLAVVLEVRSLEHRRRDRAERTGVQRAFVDGAGIEPLGTIVVRQAELLQERLVTGAS